MLPRTVTTSDHDLGNGKYSLFIGQFGLTGRVLFGFTGAKSAKRTAPPEAAPPAPENG
jgi:hypothetical protein